MTIGICISVANARRQWNRVKLVYSSPVETRAHRTNGRLNLAILKPKGSINPIFLR
ncbi:hypothetical protein HBZS_109790 [Helicobacter bizzozeronii CCUG 35545]|nr:hypothetical protein HBZS_109790 [Helicobacter bizzozeronii CCUG 35545]